MKPKAIVLLSGGVDSSTLLYKMQADEYDVTALAVFYGQKHEIELNASQAVADAAGIPRVLCDAQAALAPIFAEASCSQVGQKLAVPYGHYTDQTMAKTVVPNRNMVLLSIAGALAQSIGARTVAYAAHAGDHAIYPDCRPEFIEAIGTALWLSAEIVLSAPFQYLTKAEIVREGKRLGVPFNLTYSCYEGEPLHCGECGTCTERREAFALAEVPDPTKYKQT